MGLFDVPGPVLGWLDGLLEAVAPPVLRLVVWGAVAGILSMWLYRVLSPQARIAHGKAELLAARRSLNAYDGALEGAWPLLRHMLRVAVRQVGRVGGPALLASLPLVCLLAWLSTAYGYSFPPPGDAPSIRTAPVELEARWIDGRPTGGQQEPDAPRIRVGDSNTPAVAEVPLPEPVPIIHKRQWWNVLLGNPIGYLPRDSAVDVIRVGLPRKEYLSAGPRWVRGWELPFFSVLVVVSLALKQWTHIE
jgi:hypothetical protein